MAAATALGASAEEWALVNMSVACVREKPSHAAELGSQAVMGTPVRILGESNGWCHVETPDGYKGYIIEHSLYPMSDEKMNQWRRSSRVAVVSSDEVIAVDPTTGEAVTDLVGGCLLTALWTDKGVKVCTPDGRMAVVPDSCVMPAEAWAAQPLDTERILRYARAMNGRPYLWGGTSTKSMDCSGLTSICYYVCAGVILPRNASQQAKAGVGIDLDDISAYRQGDLITFGNPKTGKVTHVALYDTDGEYMHSSGRVKRNSLDPESPIYLDLNRLHVRRILPDFDENDGIVQVYEHPWYFDTDARAAMRTRR